MVKQSLFALSLGSGLLLAATASAQTGAFVNRTVTGDADALLPDAVSYTHAVDLNSEAGDDGAVINGVTFAAGGLTGPNYTLSGPDGSFQNFNSPADDASGLQDLHDDFFFQLNPATNEVLTLTGLTPGVTYRTTFLSGAFGGPRTQIVSADNTPVPTTLAFDQDAIPLSALDYTFTLAPGDTDITFTFDSPADNASFHQYGFANAVIPEPATVGLLALTGLGLLARRRRA